MGSVNITDDLVWQVQDQVSRTERLLRWLVEKAGGSPDEICKVDRRTPPDGFQAVV